jgi:hypothetical protein
MMQVEITRAEFEEIRMLHTEENRRIPVSFSTNSDEDVWLSPEQPVPPPDRVHVKHRSKRLDSVARILISCRPDRERAGGKFFIDWEGAFYKDENANVQRFVSWKSDEPLQIPIKPVSRSEMLAQIASKQAQKQVESRRARKQIANNNPKSTDH